MEKYLNTFGKHFKTHDGHRRDWTHIQYLNHDAMISTTETLLLMELALDFDT